ncbi:unnamed protein product [Cylicocyclus nassatus]|uniref:Dolichyl-diphosphooligosaccharide--protein glycosyltransferase subunit 1 n=1 Tax=Cylicocyclus nassatus TaxID=53992 RepID=A0AA36H8B0_CYLNA|nr:unnamed protein product [Cylicocyclus nassatus]
MGVADAGDNHTLPESSIVLNGNAKDDGSIVSYQWTQVSGPANALLVNADKAKATASGLIEGHYVFMPLWKTMEIKMNPQLREPSMPLIFIVGVAFAADWKVANVERTIDLSSQTILPASAKDIYYRDEIGNISTSAVRLRADSVDVELKPSYIFPLFGGWRTSYVIGYNVPSFEYLYNKGNNYALEMRVLDHIFDNAVVEKLTTKIILPEMIRKARLITPYSMDRRPDEVRATYLDTTGRTVIVLQKENLVPEHIQSFLCFTIEFSQMIREPLLATAFFFALFTVVIIYVRFDFTIVADPAREARERILQGNDTQWILKGRVAIVHPKGADEERNLRRASLALAHQNNKFNLGAVPDDISGENSFFIYASK